MNPPPAPSRFVRGRARGGGAYRPYFYFRRNGRTIPAGRGGVTAAAVTTTDAPQNITPAATRARGGIGARFSNRGRRAGDVSTATVAADSSFLRPEHYAAPENALQVQSIAVETPLQCPGWRLYFATELYDETSELAKRIKLLETHYGNNAAHYDLSKIQSTCCFLLQSKVVTSDVALREAWPTVLEDLRTRPQHTLATFAVAMHSLVTVASIDASLSLQSCSREFYVPRQTCPRKIFARAVGFLGVDLISRIASDALDNMFCVRGVVASMGVVEAAACRIAYKCARCGQEQALKQAGFYSSRPYSCKRDGCLAKKGFVEQRSSPHTRIAPVQIIRLVEHNLQAITDLDTEQSKYLDVELRHDLVDSLGPGQHVIVTGILKMRPLAEEQEQPQTNSFSHSKSNSREIYMKAASIVDGGQACASLTQRDLDAIAMINGESDSFKLLVQSLAPEVHGQELVKAGVLLSLLGGAGSQLHNEAEINVLLVGDPSLGKTHLLQMCAKISERGALLSGKRTSAGKQLTAVIQGRSNYSIDSGAIVSATYGHCSIDDIDRFVSQQETLLQVMQSQIISLPFPSVYATLTTPCSIIASANPMRGHYDHSKLINENIRINPSLLSEFHLVFLLLDTPNKDLDTSLTEHIRALHDGSKKSAAIAARFAIKPKTNNSMNVTLSDSDINDENYDLSERLKINDMTDEELDLLPPILIKKFIGFARQQVKPLLNEEAALALKSFFNEIRAKKDEEKGSAVSTSQLEGLIRLTQARARMDFSAEATKAHVRDVICIVRNSMADTSLGNYVDTNPATAKMSQGSLVKKFIQMLQMRSNALARRVFDFEELKDMARHAGISCGVTNLVDIVNLQGYLLKKGPNLYEVMLD